jgi:hypothetical protein
MLFIFSTPELIRNLWQLKAAVFLHWFQICALPLLKFFKDLSRKIVTKWKENIEKENCQQNAEEIQTQVCFHLTDKHLAEGHLAVCLTDIWLANICPKDMDQQT